MTSLPEIPSHFVEMVVTAEQMEKIKNDPEGED